VNKRKRVLNELRANINKINENYNFKELWYNIQNLIEKTEATSQEIVYDLNDNIEEYYLLEEIKIEMKNYIKQAQRKLGIDIYPTYIDSEAEGTDHAGEIVWCIEPELVPVVKEFSDKWTTWSTFG